MPGPVLNEQEMRDNRILLQKCLDRLRESASAGEWTRRRILVTFDFAGYYALQVRTCVEAPSRPTEKWSLGLGIVQRGSDRMRSNFLAICPSRGELIQELSLMTADRMLECLDGLIRSWIRSDDD